MSTYVKVDEERLRKIEQEGYDVLYTAEVQNYMDRKNTLETNLGRAYVLILSTYCNGTKNIQSLTLRYKMTLLSY